MDRVAPQVSLELLRRALDHDAPAIDDRQLRGEPVGLLEIVGRQQDRHLLLACEPLDLVPHFGARLRVKARRGLIEEQDLRAVQQAHRDIQAALHAAGVGLRLRSAASLEAEALQRLGDPPPQIRAG